MKRQLKMGLLLEDKSGKFLRIIENCAGVKVIVHIDMVLARLDDLSDGFLTSLPDLLLRGVHCDQIQGDLVLMDVCHDAQYILYILF